MTQLEQNPGGSIAPQVLLAIDTAIGTSVALGTPGGVFTARSDDPMRHAEVVGDLIAQVFTDSGVSPAAVHGVVSGVGPGPFTGLRVGMAAARAFAAARQLPLYPVQGHEAVALQHLELGAAASVRVVQDARRRELFVTSFSGLDWAGIPVVANAAHLVARADYVETPSDVWPEYIPAEQLVHLAARRLAAGYEFGSAEALYLRAPDVRQPGAPKRVVV